MAKIDIILLHYSEAGYIVTCKYCKRKRFYFNRSDFGNSMCNDCGHLGFGCRDYYRTTFYRAESDAEPHEYKIEEDRLYFAVLGKSINFEDI